MEQREDGREEDPRREVGGPRLNGAARELRSSARDGAGAPRDRLEGSARGAEPATPDATTAMIDSISTLLPHLVAPELLLALQATAPSAADGGGEQAPGLFGNPLIMFALMGLIFWFVLIAPERKNRKRHQEMLGALKKGDLVMTTSGMYGKVVEVKDDVVVLQASEGVRLRFARAAVQSTLEGDAKAEAKDASKDKD